MRIVRAVWAIALAGVLSGTLAVSGPAAAASPDLTDPAALEPWFEAVARAGPGGGPVRVLHLGDSHIARDTFSGDLRAMLQARAGGASGEMAARGMLPPGPVYPFFLARGVELDMSPDWTIHRAIDEAADERADEMADETANGPFGLASARIEAAPGTSPWVALSGIEAGAGLLVIGYLRQPGGGAVQVTVDGAVSAFVTDGAPGHAFAAVPLDAGGQLVRVAAAGNGPVALTSLALEDAARGGGAQVVGFGWPGATAALMARWDEALLRAELVRIDPHLIIVGYGTNEGFDDKLDLAAYGEMFAAQLARLRALAPAAAILVTGGPDGARLPLFADPDARAPEDWSCAPLTGAERAGYAALVESEAESLLRWHDPPNLDAVLRIQKTAAAAAGAAHWDWRAAMGGACAIHDWRLAEPPLARPDHVHLTAEGYAAAAAALLAALDGAFVAWGKAGEGASVP